jgi:hypothetical protein
METKLKYQALQGSAREMLSAARTYYVRTDGNDSNNGLANTAGGAFLTIQKAVDVVSALDRQSYAVTIQVAAGTYSSVVLKEGVGSAQIIIKGDTATPANVVIAVSNGTCFLASGISTQYYIQGFKFTSSNNGVALQVESGSTLYMKQCDFGGSFTYHMNITNYGSLIIDTSYTISGATTSAHASPRMGFINMNTVAVTFANTPSLVQFAEVRYCGVLWAYLTTFSGTGASAGTKKYSVDLNGAIQSGGGYASFPGGVVGTATLGGQVV